MSDYGYRPPPIRLLNEQLTLNDQTQAALLQMQLQMFVQDMESKLAAMKWRDHKTDLQGLLGTWSLPRLPLGWTPPPGGAMAQPQAQPWLQPLPGTKPAMPDWKQNFPEPPRVGEVSDVLDAVFGIEAVKQQKDQFTKQIGRELLTLWPEFKQASFGKKVVMLSATGTLAAGVVAPFVFAPSRNGVLGFLGGKAIPIFPIEGLSVTLLNDVEVKPSGPQVEMPKAEGRSEPGIVGFKLTYEREFDMSQIFSPHIFDKRK